MVENDRRVFGLDIVRSVAVSLVVFGHMLQHSKPPDWFGHLGRLGILGVEIFFVLSGFLIGGIIVELIKKGKFETGADLLSFWSRRWLRTLPLYYLFFFIYLRFDWTGATRLQDHLEFLVFLQNFYWRAPDFFLLSWSLTIEEYFYLLFPLAFYLILKVCKDPLKSMKWAIALFLVFPLVLKFARAPYPGWDEFNFNIRMVTLVRLDSLMYGVAAVFIKHYYSAAWQLVKKLTPLWFVAIIGVSAYLYSNVPELWGSPASRLIQTLIFPLISLIVALLLPYFDGIRNTRSLYIKDAITFLSKISYSMYLSHILVITIVNQVLTDIPFGNQTIERNPACLYPIYFIFILGLAPVTYYFWELPFMRLRERKKG